MNKLNLTLTLVLSALSLGVAAQTAAKKTYIVELADPPAATYAGGIAGLTATRPVAGAKIDPNAAHVRAYVANLLAKRNAQLARLGSGVPVLHHYNYSFNGFAAQLTAAQAATLKGSSGIKSITESVLIKADTSRTPGFLGLTAQGGLWSQLDAMARNIKGEDIIIGVLDTGVWPEDPSFGDKVDALGNPVAYHQPGTQVYGPPPAKWKGSCVSGEAFTAAMCNNKLIGARFYGDAFYASAASSGGAWSPHPTLEYKSPRDGGGHGSHTASTAGGNSGVAASIDGVPSGVISGIAPRARLAAYKVLWTASDTDLGPTLSHDGGQTADIVKAIDAAVADGVDVINYSISGTQTNFTDPVEIAFLNATTAGIFVAASAGNSGPANQVAHMSPWLTTVAASTHDRYTTANLVLGAPSGASFNGPSYQSTGVPNAAIVRSIDVSVGNYASMTDDEKKATERCYLPGDGGTTKTAPDPQKVNGRILVCYRGGNVLVNKAATAKAAGAVGMVIQNVPAIGATPASNNSTLLQPYVLPTVHLTVSSYSAIDAYIVANAGAASAAMTAAVPSLNVVAPVMADFSSRGPNKANPNILKPDITGPGVDIIAAYISPTNSQIQHDATIAGTYLPAANHASLQGTSMSSPHLAGVAALLKQQHPSWSPAAIKSAIMTSATGVKLASGATDPDRWGYGAGHVNPNGATATPLVYDAGASDYGRFLCGLSLAVPTSLGSCATLGSIQPQNLNLASITAASVAGTQTLTRRVTNVSGATGTFVASWAGMTGWNVSVSPNQLTLAPGASASFSVTLTRNGAPLNAWTFGSLTWSDGTSNVVSPLSARAVGFSAPALVTDVRASGSGSKLISVTSAYTGSMSVSAVGLVPATRNTSIIATDGVQCFNTVIPSGAQVARFQLFDADTQGGGAGTDLDLDVFAGPDGTGALLGSSGGSTSSEVVTLSNPVARTVSACVTGYAADGGKQYTLSSWVVGPATGAQTLRAAAPTQVYAGAGASIGIGWTVPAGARYLGNLRYFDNTSTLIGSTLLMIDNH